jgi:hypothetical protein
MLRVVHYNLIVKYEVTHFEMKRNSLGNNLIFRVGSTGIYSQFTNRDCEDFSSTFSVSHAWYTHPQFSSYLQQFENNPFLEKEVSACNQVK